MKQKRNIFLGILFLSVFAYAQDAKFSAALGYPIAVGDNFLEQYSSDVDLLDASLFAATSGTSSLFTASTLNVSFNEGLTVNTSLTDIGLNMVVGKTSASIHQGLQGLGPLSSSGDIYRFMFQSSFRGGIITVKDELNGN